MNVRYITMTQTRIYCPVSTIAWDGTFWATTTVLQPFVVVR